MEAGNHMSDNFMVDDFNIRRSSQKGYSLESFNSQWSRGPLNQYGALLQNGCVSCRSQCNLIQPLGQASLNRNGKKNNLRNRDRREGDDVRNPLLTSVPFWQGDFCLSPLWKRSPPDTFCGAPCSHQADHEGSILQGRLCCVCRDAIMVVATGYFSSCCLSVASSQSAYSDLWPLTSTRHFFHQRNFFHQSNGTHWIFSLPGTCHQNFWSLAMWKSQWISSSLWNNHLHNV